MSASSGDGPPSEPTPASPLSAWLRALVALRWPLTVLAVMALGLLGLQRGCDTVRRGQREAAESLGRTASTIAQRFSSGTITTTFIAALPELVPDGGLKLELAAFETTETLSQTDERRVLFDLLSLGTTVTEVRVPVTYRYHLRLDEPWHLDVRDHACLVRAPRIHPTLPPAIHSDRIEERVSSGWFRFDDAEQLAALERSLTPTLSAWAGDRRHLDLVREICRRRVAEFVRGWLLAADHWRSDRLSSVTVLFAGEPAEPTRLGPTIELGDSRGEDGP